MSTGHRLLATALSTLLLAAHGPASARDIDSMPAEGSPDWSVGIWSNTSMASVSTAWGPATQLSTYADAQIYFGWRVQAPPASGWTPGGPAVGNLLQMTASFSANAADWSSLIYSGNNDAFPQGTAAWLTFRPSDCGCQGADGAAGVSLLFGNDANPLTHRSLFVPVADMDQPHRYETLLKNGQVFYRIDGQVYSGAAWRPNVGDPWMLVGDVGYAGGRGAMTLHALSMDNAPLASTLVSVVPEPSQALLMLLGLAGIGLWRRPSRQPA